MEKLTPFLKGCGYNVKKDVIFIPISALAATNVLESSPNLPWYDGPTFIQALDTLPALERNKDAALRLPILSKYKDMGTVVEGKVEQGTIKPGDKLFVMPNRVPVEVRPRTPRISPPAPRPPAPRPPHLAPTPRPPHLP